ncbi:uncharacterized protein LOC142774324 [Rhipicephalus microplus]|uniref:uncharacterized protein LOC142774324 n=1 Tax=Rhipicephalus microplus TaxID=6941 RepID=UPI003F6C6156
MAAPLAAISGASIAAAATDTDVCRVAVILPPFWAEAPDVWFAKVEAQFSTACITQDRTLYDYVVTHLDSRYAAAVRDILANPPADDRYLHLKRELIHRLSPSQDEKVRHLLQHVELGDRKPSQLLRFMRDLLGSTPVDDSRLRIIWLQRLPSHAQAILHVQPNLPLDQLSHIADKVVEIPLPASPFTVNAVDTRESSSELARRVDEITRQLDSIQRRLDQSPKLRPQKCSQSHDNNAASSHGNNGPCYYRRRFALRGQSSEMSTTLRSWTSAKLQRQPVETAASCQLRGRRIIVTDQVTKRWFLVDCGSDICCFPRTFLRDKRPCTSFELSVANHSTIKTYGSLRLNVNFKNLCRDYPWNSVIADVAEPIIGSDFLAYYNLLTADMTNLSTLQQASPRRANVRPPNSILSRHSPLGTSRHTMTSSQNFPT